VIRRSCNWTRKQLVEMKRYNGARVIGCNTPVRDDYLSELVAAAQSTATAKPKVVSVVARCCLSTIEIKQYRVRIITNDGVMGVELTP
jgi:hypothetical protein